MATPTGANTVGRAALLHGGEYVEPHDVVEHYGVGAMKAIHEKRVPKGLMESFFGGGFMPFMPPLHGGRVSVASIGAAPPPVAPPVAPPVPTRHGSARAHRCPDARRAAPSNSLATTPVGPMATEQPQCFNFMGFNIPLRPAAARQLGRSRHLAVRHPRHRCTRHHQGRCRHVAGRLGGQDAGRLRGGRAGWCARLLRC